MIVLLFSLFQWRISYFIPFNRSKLRSNPETIWFTLSVYLIHYKVLSIKFMIFSFTVSFDSVCSTSSPLTRPKSTLLTFLSYTVIITPQPMSLQPLCPFSSNHVLTLFNSKPFTDYPFSLRFKKKKKKKSFTCLHGSAGSGLRHGYIFVLRLALPRSGETAPSSSPSKPSQCPFWSDSCVWNSFCCHSSQLLLKMHLFCPPFR